MSNKKGACCFATHDASAALPTIMGRQSCSQRFMWNLLYLLVDTILSAAVLSLNAAGSIIVMVGCRMKMKIMDCRGAAAVHDRGNTSRLNHLKKLFYFFSFLLNRYIMSYSMHHSEISIFGYKPFMYSYCFCTAHDVLRVIQLCQYNSISTSTSTTIVQDAVDEYCSFPLFAADSME